MPNTVDLVFAALVFVVGPSLDHFVLWPRLQRKLTGGEAGARTRVYWIIMAGLWLPTIFVVGRWVVLARPRSALWLLPPRGWRLVAGMHGVLRHSPIKVTMDVYTQAVTDAKRKAQSKVVEMIVPKKAVSQAAPA